MEVIIIFTYFFDKRLKKERARYAVQKERADFFKEKYLKEKDKRIALESEALTNAEKEYIKELIQFDEVINSHTHTATGGLYSELNNDLLDFTTTLRIKLRKS